MKFGVREICDVVLKAKANQKVGNKIFYKGEPVIYFDTLKTSSMEGAATTVYAQGGRGNARLVAWEGERTVTFTMEDALISPEGFMILSGAGLIEAKEGEPIIVHATEQTDHFVLGGTLDNNGIVSTYDGNLYVYLDGEPYFGKTKDNIVASSYGHSNQDMIYVMLLDENGEIISEPYIPIGCEKATTSLTAATYAAEKNMKNRGDYIYKGKYCLTLQKTGLTSGDLNNRGHLYGFAEDASNNEFKLSAVLVDYYVEKKSGAYQVDITADKFGGNYYLEASTLFRSQSGQDMPAEFIIPNCKIQSNFTFTMASSGDPSSFTFTMDAFPDYTKFDTSKKVLAAIQVINEGSAENALRRASTPSTETHEYNETSGAAIWRTDLADIAGGGTQAAPTGNGIPDDWDIPSGG